MPKQFKSKISWNDIKVPHEGYNFSANLNLETVKNMLNKDNQDQINFYSDRVEIKDQNFLT